MLSFLDIQNILASE